jgi:hypothetical protein
VIRRSQLAAVALWSGWRVSCATSGSVAGDQNGDHEGHQLGSGTRFSVRPGTNSARGRSLGKMAVTDIPRSVRDGR